MKCTCGSPLTPRVMHRVKAPCYRVQNDNRAILEEMMAYPSSHAWECLTQGRCVCGHYERQNADFEARLKRAMERYPDKSTFNHAAHREFLRGL